MFNDWFGSSGLSSLSARQSNLVVQQSSDLTLKLNERLEIEGVQCAPPLNTDQFEAWVGKPLNDVVSIESRPKIDRLLADNSAASGSESRWRHLNFRTGKGDSLPLLLKFFRFVNEGTAAHLIVARDLSPVVNAQQSFVHEQSRMEREYEQKHKELKDAAHVLPGQASVSDLLGKLPLDEIVARTVQIIEDACINQAYARCNQDVDAASRLLGIQKDKFLSRLKKPQ